MRHVGVDLSLTNTGMAFLGDDGKEWTLSVKGIGKKFSDIERQLRMVNSISHLVRRGDIVCVEDFGVGLGRGRGSGKLVERLEMLGMIKLEIWRITRLPVLTCPPTWLKMFGTGKGNAEKIDVCEAVSRELEAKCRPANDDEADAYVLARIARELMNGCTCEGKRAEAVQNIREHKVNVWALTRIRAAIDCNAFAALGGTR